MCSTPFEMVVIAFIFLLTVSQIYCETDGRKKATSISPATKITNFIDDVTDFLTDILYSVSKFIGMEKDPAREPSWTLDKVAKYTIGTLKSGFKMVRNAIPLLKGARQSVEEVSEILPNVTLATLIEHIITNVAPELMKEQT